MFLINRLNDVLVRLIDLIEAEGRLVKINALRVVQALILVVMAGVLAAVGIVVLDVAIYQALRLAHLPAPLASLISALALLGAAIIAVAVAHHHIKGVGRRPGSPPPPPPPYREDRP